MKTRAFSGLLLVAALMISIPAAAADLQDGGAVSVNGRETADAGSILIRLAEGRGYPVPDEGVAVSDYLWNTETVDASEGVGLYASLALDNSGNPHISYFNTTGNDLKYAKRTASGWVTEIVETDGSVGMESSIAVDASGNPHISYFSNLSGLKYASRTGVTGWVTTTVEHTLGSSSSLALDASGNPHISYMDSICRLRYAYWAAETGWVTETVDSSGNVGWDSSLALDASGNPHISYYNTTGQNLKYAHRTGTGWVNGTVDSSGNVGWGASIALDSSGNPHISYYNWSAITVKYAIWTGPTGWVSMTVDDSMGIFSSDARDTSLALDSSDNPHIAYKNVTGGELKYAGWTLSDGWVTGTVDSGIMGYSNSLALDASGNPYIAYLDFASQYLKYAYTSPLPPAPRITGLSPKKKTAGSPKFTLSVNGANFTRNSTVRWNGSNRTTRYVSPVLVTAKIPAKDVKKSGSFNVTVANPPPGGGVSNAFRFRVK